MKRKETSTEREEVPAQKPRKAAKRNIYLEAWEELKAAEVKRAQDIAAAWSVMEKVVDCLDIDSIRAIKLILSPVTCDRVTQQLADCASELSDQLYKHQCEPRAYVPLQVFPVHEIQQKAEAMFFRAFPTLQNKDYAMSTLLHKVADPEWREIIRSLKCQKEELCEKLEQFKNRAK